jgi:predicted dehydrogenase
MKVAIVGCGDISHEYVRGLGEFDFIRVTACADEEIDRARSVAAECGAELAGNLTDVLADSSVEIVLNLTPPTTHARVTSAAITAGKHVFSEKPLATTLEEGEALLRQAEERGVVVGCAPDTVLGSAVQTGIRLIDDGWLGEVRCATATVASHGYETFHPRPHFYYRRGGGPALDMGPYYLTSLVHMLGPMRRVCASAARFDDERVAMAGPNAGRIFEVEVPTHFSASIEFANGVVATVVSSWEVWKTESPFLELHGTEGSLSIGNPDLHAGSPRVYRPGVRDLTDEDTRGGDGWVQIPSLHEEGVCRGVGVADLVQHIRRGSPHRTNGTIALHTLEALLAFETSAATGESVPIRSRCEKPPPLPSIISGQGVRFA